MTYPKGLLIKVSEMYYYQKLSQKAIGEKLGMSVPTVSRVLAMALEEGYIHVRIADAAEHIGALEAEIAARFSLKSAQILRLPASYDAVYLKKLLGKMAGEALYEYAKPGESIGMGPGVTMLELVESLNPERGLPGITLVPLMGGWGFGGVAYEGNKILSAAATTLHCDFRMMPCPALVSSQAVYEVLMKEPLIQEIVGLWKSISIAVFSIGGEVGGGNYPQLRGNDDALAIAQDRGAVGDILGRFIGPQGEELDLEVNKRIFSLPFSLLARIPVRIGIGGGGLKIRAMRAALKARLINVLISDETTCEAILKLEEEENE